VRPARPDRDRPDLIGTGIARPLLPRRAAPHGRSRTGPDRDRVGRPDRSLRGHRLPRLPCVLRLPEATEVTSPTDPVLLPRPRAASFSDDTVDAREPIVSRDRTMHAEGYRLLIGRACRPHRGRTTPERRTAAPPSPSSRARCDGRLPIGNDRRLARFSRCEPSCSTSRATKCPPSRPCSRAHRRFGPSGRSIRSSCTRSTPSRSAITKRCGATPAHSPPTRSVSSTHTARPRHIELVPNQNCLGHAGTLVAPRQVPTSSRSPRKGSFEFGEHRSPSTLDPRNPESLALVRSLLAELLPNFASRRVNVGLDEPWEAARRPDRRLSELGRAATSAPGARRLRDADVGRHPRRASRAHRTNPRRRHRLRVGLRTPTSISPAGAAVLAASGHRFWLCPGHVELAVDFSAVSRT